MRRGDAGATLARRYAAWPAAALALAAALLTGPGVATALAAGTTGEAVESFDATYDLQADGSMRVTERIRYTFPAGEERHGIERFVATRFERGADQVRVYPLQGARVSEPTGPTGELDVEDQGASTRLRVGSPDVTVSGTRTYVLSYTQRAVANTFPDHDELYWNVTGDRWSVPIRSASVTVTAPAASDRALCFRGASGSNDPCEAAPGATARLSTTDLAPGNGMTVVLSYPKGTVDATPLIEDAPREGLARVLDVHPAAVAGGLALPALALLGMGALVRRRGRDVYYAGLTPGLAPVGAADGAPTTTQAPPDPGVQFTPPKDFRPGELGTLLDEQANVVDVTATIVDLAVRGYLRIEEVPKKGWFGSEDWRLVVVTPAPPVADLRPYELALMQAVFKGRDEVSMSDLKDTFAADLVATQRRLYDDVVRLGWFRGDPDRVRRTWQRLSLVPLVGGAALAWVGGQANLSVGALGVGLVASGAVVRGLAGRMPARTAKGTAVLTQLRGFRRYLETAEADQIRFEEGEDVFSRYLPYAIIFGVAERWAGIFARLAASGAAVTAPTWYVGSTPYFDYSGFGHSMSSFATTTAGALASTPSSSGGSGFGGGGFSGGGGGGGGGGSW